MNLRQVPAVTAVVATLAACGTPDGFVNASATNGRLSARQGTVIVEACLLAPDQLASLSAPATHRIVSDVVLRCLHFDEAGALGTIYGPTLEAARTQVDAIHALGYRVHFAVTTVRGANPDRVIASPATWATVATALADPALGVDGIDVALPVELSNNSRTAVSGLIDAIASRVRPARTLSVWAPPSVHVPSDLPGGDAYDIPGIGPRVDRVRLMTLDFSCCGAPTGPTADPGWSVDVARLARSETTAAIDIAVPLYGYRFEGSTRNAVPITWYDAVTAASNAGVSPTRDPGGELTFVDASHFTWWYDDAQSTLRGLLAFDPATLPADVGTVFYGLGAEDPALWTTLSGALP
ncbi:MAG: hypothetical protein WCJ30_13300 [Deltaproteobacteria bacterium]